jgi:C4-dicarboxylate-specific signal transduction histidine kinase
MWLRRRISSTTKTRQGTGGDAVDVELPRHGSSYGTVAFAGYPINRGWQSYAYVFPAYLLGACLSVLVGAALLIAVNRSGDLFYSSERGDYTLLPWSAHSIPLLISAFAILNLAVLALVVMEDRSRRWALATLRIANRGATLTEKLAHLGTWSWDAKGDRLQLTDESRELLSIESNKPVSVETFVSAFHRDDRTMIFRALKQAVKFGQSFACDARVIRRDGTIQWLQVGAKVIHLGDTAQSPRLLFGVAVDITERKRMERDVDNMGKQLRRLAQAASFGSLSGALAHELNQPLAAIMSNAQAAERMLKEQPINVTELSNTLRDIIDDDSRAGAVITHLRALFKNDESAWTAVNINDVLRETVPLLTGDLSERKIDLAVRATPNMPSIRANRVQLRQVILNLVTNAAEAMDESRNEAPRIRIESYLDEEGFITLAVSDTGPGLPAGNESAIFAPFFTTKAQGLGLGLSICRSIVTSHGGRLWALNNPERGSTFFIALPASKERSFE